LDRRHEPRIDSAIRIQVDDSRRRRVIECLKRSGEEKLVVEAYFKIVDAGMTKLGFGCDDPLRAVTHVKARVGRAIRVDPQYAMRDHVAVTSE